jgi:coproporphyrinogen III oxidase-like Fe-S oxidoreductase
MGKVNRLVSILQLHQAIHAHRAGEPTWALFPRRVRTPRAAREALPLAPIAEAQRELEASLECTGPLAERVVYVHVPFCRSLCSFCGYRREIPASPDTVREYAAAVRRQLTVLGARPWTQAGPFSAIHFGGGTPTLLPLDVLAALVRDVVAALPLAQDAEITVESTVSAIEEADLSVLVAAGVNRIALGVQTFDSERRHALGRRSSREEVLTRIAQVRRAGVANLCVDLLYGLPGQTVETWKADLDLVGSCGATGASAYPLVPFPSSQLGRQLVAQRRDSFVDLATEYALFMAADSALLRVPGWARFSPVQYGHASAGTAAYISACGRGAEVLALGVGAAGNVNRLAYLNTPNIEEYLRAWSEGGPWPVTAARSNDAHEQARRLYALGESTRLVRIAESPEPQFVDEIIGNLVEIGLAKIDGDVISLTADGCFWAGNICEIFSLAMRDESSPS